MKLLNGSQEGWLFLNYEREWRFYKMVVDAERKSKREQWIKAAEQIEGPKFLANIKKAYR